jgi:hypothetical protein
MAMAQGVISHPRLAAAVTAGGVGLQMGEADLSPSLGSIQALARFAVGVAHAGLRGVMPLAGVSTITMPREGGRIRPPSGAIGAMGSFVGAMPSEGG